MSEVFKVKQRLAFRLAKYSVVMAFVIGLVLTTAQVLEDFHVQDSQFDKTIHKILNASKPPATRAVHTLDHTLAKEVVFGLMQYSFISEVRISDELGEVLASQVVPDPVKKSSTLWLTEKISSAHKTYTLDLQAPGFVDIAPGKLQVVVNKDQAFQPFFERALTIFVAGLVRNVLLAICLIAIFHVVLTKPLARLASQFASVDLNASKEVKLQVPDVHKDTELGLLNHAGNEFISTVHNLVHELRDSHQALSKSEARLAQLINQVPQLIMAINKNGDILFANRQFAEFYETPVTEIAGHALLKLHPYIEEVAELESIRRCVEVHQTEAEISDFTWTHKSGKTMHYTVQAAPFEYFSEPVVLFAATDISEQKMVQDHISHMANHDSLTGLPNRTLLNDRLELSLANSQRNGKCNGLLFIDLDHFKTINDSLGHSVGDQLLKKVADILTKQVRASDTVARLGGDEFVILLQSFDGDEEEVTKDIEHVCEKLLELLAEPIEVKQHQLRIGASIGIVLYPLADKGIDDLMRFADTAMYHAKESGRNGYAFYHHTMTTAVEKQQNMENQLHCALEREEFRVHYQPLVDVSGEVFGFEALIRWQHPERGLVPPIEFIPSLEVSGMIVPVSNWLIGECSRQIVEWKKSGFWRDGWYLSINISPLQFYQADMIPALKEAITQAGADVKNICLEITETVAVENIEFAVSRLQKIRDLGIKIALDDFGTGYSSLSYLKDLPIDIVKIDRSFVQELGDNSKSQCIVEAVINIAKAYNLRVIAEGVETKEQLIMANKVGCHVFQGFYIERPQPPKSLRSSYLKDSIESKYFG
ncbi:putative bifunctional diguanylate cyclase/phosphodiesterase [Neptuniibacter sp. PT8_73]|uniref:putative bifunctional diguanylate cyclase/phosphodiesterase n=1 Tax=unclassified Neptuniibacter TaxID=2630693 RepID=UPI0039F67D71